MNSEEVKPREDAIEEIGGRPREVRSFDIWISEGTGCFVGRLNGGVVGVVFFVVVFVVDENEDILVEREIDI